MTIKMRPMLCESADLEDLGGFLGDPRWVAQQKLDGERMLVVVDNGQVQVLNRSGQPKQRFLSHKMLAAFEDFDANCWVFDGEFVNGTLHLFDLVQAGSLIVPAHALEHRLMALEHTFNEWSPGDSILLVPTARTTEEKGRLVAVAQEMQLEGVVFKRLGSPYQPGRRSPNQLKLKFTHDLDCIITDLHHEGKDNAILAVLDPENDRVVEIGRASTIGKKPTPQVGDVWEVRYLYFTDTDQRLYQPRLMRKRTDKAYEECLFSQLVTTSKHVVDKSRIADV